MKNRRPLAVTAICQPRGRGSSSRGTIEILFSIADGPLGTAAAAAAADGGGGGGGGGGGLSMVAVVLLLPAGVTASPPAAGGVLSAGAIRTSRTTGW